MRLTIARTFCIAGLCMLGWLSNAWGCTGIEVSTKDGSYINGRTVEFGMSLDLAGLIVPRNYEFKTTLPDGSTGFTYRAKYAAVGGNTFGSPAIVDGLNEKGLTVAMFYFPGYAGYANVTSQNKTHALSPVDFPNWILTQFATIDEVRQAIKNVAIVPTVPKGWPALPPFHYIVYDKSGKSIVIEPTNGQLTVYDDPLGILTNSPTFDWHLTNLSNYTALSPLNVPSITIDGMKLKQFGEGSGLHGLPGDFTPPSRFVRAAVFEVTAQQLANAQQAVLQVFHLLNQFDIPVGAVRDATSNSVALEYTLATTVKDPQNLIYYFKTYDDQTIKMIALNKFDLNGKVLKTIPMNSMQSIVDVSATAQ